VTQYDGWPNGLKIHRDGRIFIADYKRGLMILDPGTGKVEPLLETAFSEGFKGLNDLHFADNGDLYFTDQGRAGSPTRAGGCGGCGRAASCSGWCTTRLRQWRDLELKEFPGVRGDDPLAADLAPAADGGRHAVEDRRRDPALRRPCRARRHRDGRGRRPAGVPPRRRHLGASTRIACRPISLTPATSIA